MKLIHIILILLGLGLIGGGVYFFFFSETAKKKRLVKQIMALPGWGQGETKDVTKEMLMAKDVKILELVLSGKAS